MQQLYRGKLYPLEQIHVDGKKYRAACRKNCEQCERLAEKLKGIDASLEKDFQTALEGSWETAGMEAEEVFTAGFRLGARLMLEVFWET